MKETRRLSSTTITHAAWDPDTGKLELTFASGESYDYESVPQDVFEGLVAAPSAGRFFHQFIKGQY